MYAIGNKVKACIEEVYRIGTVEEVLVNPSNKNISYMVHLPSINECLEFFEDELLPYKHSHITNAFSKEFYEARQSDAENN